MAARTRERRIETLTWSAGGRAAIDFLKDRDLVSPLSRIILRFAFQQTSATPGTLNQDASIRLLASRLELTAHHKDLGEVKIVDMGADALSQLWHTSNDLIGEEQDSSDPTAAADGRRDFTIVLDSPWAVHPYGSRLDPRDLSSLQLRIEFGALTDYSPTPVIANATVAVLVEEIVEGVAEGFPYFVAQYVAVQQRVESVSTDLVTQGMICGALVPLASISPHDDSAAGNAKRNAPGLVRRVTLTHDGRNLLDKAPWEQLEGNTRKRFPLSFTTTRRNGPVSVLFDKQRNFLGMVDNRAKPMSAVLDTSTTPPQGTTAITPATSDRLDFIFLCLKANRKMQPVVAKFGYRD